jgi:hypothetical protein
MAKPLSRVHLDNLAEAYRQIVLGAAVNFPEGGTDLAKWEWSKTLIDVLVEAYKRKNLPPDKIVKASERAIRRLLERQAADAIAASASKLEPLEAPGEASKPSV